jgi:membrane-associated HD superfamily phosphohydrolase
MLFSRKETSQISNSLLSKFSSLNQYSLGLNPFLSILLVLAMLLIIFFVLKKSRTKKTELKFALILLILTLIISFLVPIKIHSHYVFAFLTLFFLILSFLEIKFSLFFLLILIPAWINPNQLDSYFHPAIRTIKESQVCAESFCATHQDSMVVAGQSSYLASHHNAMEWQYFLSEAGCQIKDLTTEVSEVNNMAVVIDDSDYQHGLTQFNELTIFGNSRQLEEFTCSDKLKIYYLEKD